MQRVRGVLQGGARRLSTAAAAAPTPAPTPAPAPAPADPPYLHRSLLPSYYFQPSLLQLPIPTLPDTLARYLRSLAPLVSPACHARTSALVAAFASGDGLRLQAALLDNARRAPHTSYISEDWFDMYLTTRCVLGRVAGGIPPSLHRLSL
jgi:hypothetical protein